MKELRVNSSAGITWLMLPLWTGVAAGQEEPAPTIDFRYDEQYSWQSMLMVLVVCVALCLLWKFLLKLLEAKRSTIEWHKLRIWWPTAMLISGWMVVVLVTQVESHGWFLNVIGFAFATINIPALALIGVVLGLLNETLDLPVWLRLLVGSVALWIGNYMTVRVAEWRAWIDVPVALNLGRSSSESLD